jgi:hypothetical protein
LELEICSESPLGRVTCAARNFETALHLRWAGHDVEARSNAPLSPHGGVSWQSNTGLHETRRGPPGGGFAPGGPAGHYGVRGPPNGLPGVASDAGRGRGFGMGRGRAPAGHFMLIVINRSIYRCGHFIAQSFCHLVVDRMSCALFLVPSGEVV